MRPLRLTPARIAFPILFALAVTLALWNTLSEPLWLDEAYSLYAAEKGWWFLWHVVPRYETHPPFYYSLVRLWIDLAGSSVGAVRLPGAIALGATVGLAMFAARDAARYARVDARAAALIPIAAGLLVALAPALQGMARELRPYPIMIMVYAGAIAALLRLGLHAQAGAPVAVRPLALFLLAEALMLWLHNLGPLYALALVLALTLLVVRRDMSRRDWALLIGGQLLVGLLYLPAFLIMIDQAPTWIRATWLRFSWASVPIQLEMIFASNERFTVWLTAALAAAALAALFADRGRARLAAALAVLTWLPVALAIGISATVSPVFIPRIMTALAVPMMLILAFSAASPLKIRTVVLAMLPLLALQYLIRDVRAAQLAARQDWYGTVAWLRPRLQRGDQIWAYPNEGALPLRYALRDRGVTVPLRSIPTAVPSIDVPGGWYPTGSRGVVSLPRDRLRAIVGSGSEVPTIWLLRLGANAYDVGDVFLEELSRERRPVARWTSGAIDVIGLRRPIARPDGPAGAGEAR